MASEPGSRPGLSSVAAVSPRYDQWRHAVRALVMEVVGSGPSEVRVKGSFARGDFHLKRDGTSTYSDLDLIFIDISEPARFDLADEMSGKLSEVGLHIPVSVQPLDAFAGLPHQTSRYLHLGEFLRRAVPLPPGDPSLDYLRAKLAINLRPRGSSLAQGAATLTKVGVRENFDESTFRRALLAGGGWSASESVFVDVATGQSDFNAEIAARYVEGLDGQTGISPWLSSLMAGLVRSATDGERGLSRQPNADGSVDLQEILAQ